MYSDRFTVCGGDKLGILVVVIHGIVHSLLPASFLVEDSSEYRLGSPCPKCAKCSRSWNIWTLPVEYLKI